MTQPHDKDPAPELDITQPHAQELQQRILGKLDPEEAAFFNDLVQAYGQVREDNEEMADVVEEHQAASEEKDRIIEEKDRTIRELGRTVTFSGNIINVSSQTIDALREAGELDEKTGIYNSKGLERRYTEMAQVAEDKQHPVAVCFVDIDEFRQYNATHGHAGGDAVLRHVAERMKARLREGDIIGRYSEAADEFIAFLPDTTYEKALKVAEALRQAVEEPIMLSDQATIVTVTVGVDVPHSNFTLEAAVKAADKAMMEAKRAGNKNRVVPVSDIILT